MNISSGNANAKEKGVNQQGCCRRLCEEFRLGFFDLRVAPRAKSEEEEEETTSECYWMVDIPNSFAPQQPTWWLVLIIKFIFWGLTLSTIIMGWAFVADNAGFYLAYFTHWTLLLSFFYLTLSLFNSSPFCQPQKQEGQEVTATASCMVKLTWGLFAVVAHAEILVTLLFWLLVYDGGEILYTTVMGHGIVMILVLLDGLVVNRIPIRMKHFAFCNIYYVLYILWSVIHSFTNIGNPDADPNDPDADQTSIYGALDWDGNPGGTAVTVVLAFGVASPILFLLLWTLALYNPRTCRFDGSNRKCITNVNNNTDDDEEPGDVELSADAVPY